MRPTGAHQPGIPGCGCTRFKILDDGIDLNPVAGRQENAFLDSLIRAQSSQGFSEAAFGTASFSRISTGAVLWLSPTTTICIKARTSLKRGG